MGLTAALLRAGATRPHVLIATAPGGTAVRVAAEAVMRRRDWPAALTPADADVLLVAGDPPEDFCAAVDEVWSAVPAPRARIQVRRDDEVAAALGAARSRLRDREAQSARAGALCGRHGATDHGDGDADHGHGDGDGDGDQDGGHGHGDMEMPGGLPMAGRGEDRDGLKLDQLHVPFGPVLPDWPAGLVIHLTLQGDVIQRVDVETVGLGGAARPFWTRPWQRATEGERVAAGEAARWLLAGHLDSLGRFLAVAGWEEAADTARRLRDEALAGLREAPAGLREAPAGLPEAPAGVREAALGQAVRRFARRVGRSRVLAWATRDLGVLRPGEAADFGVRGPALRAGGDVTARYRRWCGELSAAVAFLGDRSPLDPAVLGPPRGALDGPVAPSAGLIAALPRLLTGTEFAAARLIIASLDPDTGELTRAGAGAAHGR